MVLHNDDLNQVSWEMREAGDPRYDTSQLLEDMDYAGYAACSDFTGIRVDDPDDVEDAWDEAFAADRPVVLDVLTDKNVPPLPAHVTFDQAKGVAGALLHGDPDAGAVMANSARAVASQMFALAGRSESSDDGRCPTPSRLGRSAARFAEFGGAIRRSVARAIEGRSTGDRVEGAAYTVPTKAPETDGTLEWDATTIVVVEVAAASDDGDRIFLRRAGGAGWCTTRSPTWSPASMHWHRGWHGTRWCDPSGTRAEPASPAPPSLQSTSPCGICAPSCSG